MSGPFRHAVISQLQEMGVPISRATRNFDAFREQHGSFSGMLTPAEVAEQVACLRYPEDMRSPPGRS